jgi:hypothetical protein
MASRYANYTLSLLFTAHHDLGAAHLAGPDRYLSWYTGPSPSLAWFLSLCLSSYHPESYRESYPGWERNISTLAWRRRY